MNAETKSRLQARLLELIDSVTEHPTTIDEWENLVLDLRERFAQATLDEIGHELSSPPKPETDSVPSVPNAKDDAPSSCSCKLACPHCGKGAWYKGARRRVIVTLAGRLTLSRRYYNCRKCRKGFCPTDTALGVAEKTSLTVRVQQEFALLCGCLSYTQAAQTLCRLSGVTVSSRTGQRLCVGEAGGIAHAFVQKQERLMLPLAFAERTRLRQLAPHLPTPAVLYAVADGIQTPMRNGSWREMKIGAVQTRHPDGRVDQFSRYVSHLGSSDRFADRLEATAIGCGSLGAKHTVFLGDGASWLWHLAQERFPCATHIVDFFHAMEYAGQVARAAFGEGQEAAKAWLSARTVEMKKSQWFRVRQALKAIRARNEATEEAVGRALRYFRNNAERMDYACYLRQGMCIGSGLAESSCKRLVTQRLKGSGMRWSECGAQAICALRCLLLGEQTAQWNVFCQFWHRTRKSTAETA